MQLRHETGQGLVEYALIIALVAIVVIVALVLVGNAAQNALTDVGNAVGGHPSTPVATATP